MDAVRVGSPVHALGHRDQLLRDQDLNVADDGLAIAPSSPRQRLQTHPEWSLPIVVLTSQLVAGNQRLQDGKRRPVEAQLPIDLRTNRPPRKPRTTCAVLSLSSFFVLL